jgi:glycosyltransferase involved in cell wall biosynthesis
MAKMSRTLFLYYDPHYFHSAMAKAVKAEPWPAPKIRSAEGNPFQVAEDALSTLTAVLALPKDYDTYFCEGTYLFPALAKKFGLLKKETKIINIVSSPLFYYLKTGRIGGMRKSMAVSLLKQVDGFVCVGKMEEGLLKSFAPSANTMVTYPFIRKEVRSRIIKAGKPLLKSKKILFVGNRDTYYKGIDLLVVAFRIARQTIPDLELTILGDYDKDVIGKDKKGISCPGYVENTSKYIKEASLYVHLGRGEAFGVSVMEAMLGGLPVLVSNATGAKEIVSKIDQGMVVPLDASRAADQIVRYFKLGDQQKAKLAAKGIEAVKKYQEEAVISQFKKDYAKLLLHP